MKKVNELKAGAILSYVNIGISCIIPMFYTPLMLRLLGQAEYGLYSLSQSVISYLSLLTLGLGSTIMVYMMKYRANGEKEMFERVTGLFLLIYAVIALVTCAVGCGLVVVSENFFAKGLTMQEISKLNTLILVATASTALSFIASVFSSIVICYEKYIFRRILDMILTIIAPISNLIILYLGYASVGMAVINFFAQSVVLAIYIWYCVKCLDVTPRFGNLPIELLRGVFSFTAFVFVGLIADLLYWATDKVLIGAMLGTVSVAVYNIGSTFNAMLQNLAGAISGVFGPRVNTHVVKGEPISVISELMIRVGRLQYLLVALVLSGYIAFGRSFIFIWAGKEYVGAYSVALMTMVPLAIPLIQNIAFTTICAQKRHQFRSVLYTVLAIVNVIGTYLIIPVMGIDGAALCTCVVFVVGHGVIMNWFYYKKIGLDIPGFWKNIVQMTIVPGLMTLLAMILGEYVLDFNVPTIFVSGIVVFTCIYCMASWLFVMNQYEKDIVIGLLRKLKIIKR